MNVTPAIPIRCNMTRMTSRCEKRGPGPPSLSFPSLLRGGSQRPVAGPAEVATVAEGRVEGIAAAAQGDAVADLVQDPLPRLDGDTAADPGYRE